MEIKTSIPVNSKKHLVSGFYLGKFLFLVFLVIKCGETPPPVGNMNPEGQPVVVDGGNTAPQTANQGKQADPVIEIDNKEAKLKYLKEFGEIEKCFEGKKQKSLAMGVSGISESGDNSSNGGMAGNDEDKALRSCVYNLQETSAIVDMLVEVNAKINQVFTAIQDRCHDAQEAMENIKDAAKKKYILDSPAGQEIKNLNCDG